MSRRHKSLLRRLAAIGFVSAAAFIVTIQYARLLKPAAAREVVAACNGLRPAASNTSFGELPTTVPVNFTAQDFRGNTVSLSDYRGKIVFVNFWATWCNVCKNEKPGLTEMAAELESDDFVVLTVASNRSWEDIRAYYPNGSSLKVLLDPPAGDDNLGVITKSFGITAVPESFVIDRQGRIRYYFINKRDWHSSVAETCLKSLVEE